MVKPSLLNLILFYETLLCNNFFGNFFGLVDLVPKGETA